MTAVHHTIHSRSQKNLSIRSASQICHDCIGECCCPSMAPNVSGLGIQWSFIDDFENCLYNPVEQCNGIKSWTLQCSTLGNKNLHFTYESKKSFGFSAVSAVPYQRQSIISALPFSSMMLEDISLWLWESLPVWEVWQITMPEKHCCAEQSCRGVCNILSSNLQSRSIPVLVLIRSHKFRKRKRLNLH